MPQSQFEEYFAELTRKLDALEAEVAASEVGKHFEDLKREIRVLYEAMRENHLLLETVLEKQCREYLRQAERWSVYLSQPRDGGSVQRRARTGSRQNRL